MQAVKAAKQTVGPGVVAQGGWGALLGSFGPSRLRQLRGNALRAAAVAKACCSVTSLRLILNGWDPFVALPTRLLGSWIRQMRRRPDHLAMAQAAWARIVHNIASAGKRRWSVVKGPISAVVASVMDMGCPP